MPVIDGSQGEGGGQILRTALSLSLLTGTPFCIDRIRAGRPRPGLARQHLTAVDAATRIGRATVEGAHLGSTRLEFAPTTVETGAYVFDVGTAGSTTLVLQTVLPPLLTARGPSRLTLRGGTHNPFAPPVDFLAGAFLPLVRRMGPACAATLERPGFYPAGGGLLHVEVVPTARLQPLDLAERGAIRRVAARVLNARLPQHIADRELRVVHQRLGWAPADMRVDDVSDAFGGGNALILEVESEHVTEVFTAIAQRGVPAEAVARKAVEQVERYLAAGVPVGEHLADQLLLPLALAGGGRFRTLAPSRHARTNAQVIAMFLDCEVTFEEEGPDQALVRVRGGWTGSETRGS